MYDLHLLSNWRLLWALNTSVHFGVWAQNENVSRRVGFNRWRHVTKNRSMGHRSAVTFDTVCLILFVSCVLSFRLSLRLFYVFLLFLISTSPHNTTNFLSLTQQQQPLPHPSSSGHHPSRSSSSRHHRRRHHHCDSTEIPPKTRKT